MSPSGLSRGKSSFVPLLVVTRGIIIKKDWLSVADLLSQAAASKWAYQGIRGVVTGLCGDLVRASEHRWSVDRALTALVIDCFVAALEHAKSEVLPAPGLPVTRALLRGSAMT